MNKQSCPICGKDKIYKNKITFEKCKHKPCRSCANAIQKGNKRSHRVIDGKKFCRGCEDEKLVKEFRVLSGKYISGLCIECSKESFRTWVKGKGKYRKYKISKEIFDEMYLNQNGKCKICDDQLIEPCIDHNHHTMKVRGLLCRKCNSAIGLLKESEEILLKAINYLKNGH